MQELVMTTFESDQPLPAENKPGEIETSQSNLEDTDRECVQAESIRLSQCGVGRIEAGEAKVSDSGVSQVYAESAAVRDSAVGYVQAKSVYLAGGGAVLVVSNAATLTDSRNGVVISREVHGSQVNSVLLLANKVTGPVETLVDQRGLVLIGIVAGAVLGTVFSLFRLFKRH
jgi:hypothetical protein